MKLVVMDMDFSPNWRRVGPITLGALVASIAAFGAFLMLLPPEAKGSSGGVQVGTPVTPADEAPRPTPPRPAPGGRLRGWVDGFTTTEYYPTPERWFAGPLRPYPGLQGRHRVSWLLSAHGVAMEGDGWSTTPTGPGTRWVNYVSGSVGWLNARALPTSPGGPYGWSNGAPAWLACGWVNRRGQWTFPRNYMQRGSRMVWARGRPARWVGCDVKFQAGVGRKLRFWNSVAVDPSLFPMGRTWFYIPAYRTTRCGGWFRADDTGGAIRGRHLDIYRPPHATPTLTGTSNNQRVLIVRNRKPPANPCR